MHVPIKYNMYALNAEALYCITCSSSLATYSVDVSCCAYNLSKNSNLTWCPQMSSISFRVSPGSAPRYVTIISSASSLRILSWPNSLPLIKRCSMHDTSYNVIDISPCERWTNDISKFHISTNANNIPWLIVEYSVLQKSHNLDSRITS